MNETSGGAVKSTHRHVAVKIDPFESELAECERVVHEHVVRKGCEWYQRTKRRSRILYRVSGALTIFLSACIPLLSAYSGAEFRVAVAIIGVVISCATGFNAFFRWDRTWRAQSAAQFDIEHLLQAWERKIAAAKALTNRDAALDMIRVATDEILEDVRKIKHRETIDFFENVGAQKKT